MVGQLGFAVPRPLATSITPSELPELSRTTAMSQQEQATSALSVYKYHLLFGLYATVTGAAFYRVSRQPYNTAIKWEQYETIFKGTTLAATIAGIAMNGSVNKRRSATLDQISS